MERSFLHMPAMTFVAPLLPGKEEEWRRFVQEVFEDGYEARPGATEPESS
jgi:hypothetical protein